MSPGAKIKGVLPVVHVPYGADGGIDWESFNRQIEWIFEVGADGASLALVSDILRLKEKERLELGYRLVEACSGRGPVIISVSSQKAKEAYALAREAQGAGCDAIMAMPPLADSGSLGEIEEYYRTLVDLVDLPVIVQDASGYVGKPIPVEFQVQLMEHFGPERIMFKPESLPLGAAMSRIRDLTQGRAKILEGSGGISLVDCYHRGIVGTIPGCDLLDGIVALWRALKAGDNKRVDDISYPVSAIVALQMQGNLDGYMSIERYLMKKRGIFKDDRARPPIFWTPDAETLAEVDRLFAVLQERLKG